MKPRKDDFKERSKHLQKMTEEELNQYFWHLVEKVVDPLIELAETHTSPSVERSVLLRMGFNSLEASKIVDLVFQRNLLGKGAGHIVWRIAKEKNMDILDAGRALIEGKYWEDVDRIFKGVNNDA
ncbi:ornithine aminomutase [Thermosipho affectus]|uniref:Ornithine aminomutase n=1 Tax=Thermosipho affectus TaxID=660294 RepID=A0ABX3IKY9_9BACT|nr:ornithine aminomutase subunit alpha [Thermosipho sp. 1244]ANQ53839.1 ornithine aminomutase [Thermosipho sp. 1070]APT72285.1 ornithine aminomutase [Thermosipho sp. 1063]ONN27192.1 ornithine aminomutase [Thermosipho affectus]OOC43532.1 ornithine aminomutase [Thermosipho sp. 1074]OOC46574.1 ornithine aminomutase [Thermosipho sp. 1223]